MFVILAPTGHDDTAQINAALAQVFNAGGGWVYLRNGHYHCRGPYDAFTHSILKTPFVGGYQGIPRSIALVGESRGSVMGTNVDHYVGGVLIDCRNAPPRPTNLQPWEVSVFAVAPYVGQTLSNPTVDPAIWNHTNVFVDNIAFALPAGSGISCLQFANSMQARIGNGIHIFTAFVDGTPLTPVEGTVGIWMPQVLNNFISNVGSCIVGGFGMGLVCADHTQLYRPIMIYNTRGLFAKDAAHLISGDICVERCKRLIEIENGVTVTMAIKLQAEIDTTNWWASDFGLLDAGNNLRGKIDYEILQLGTGYVPLTVNGGANVHLTNLRA